MRETRLERLCDGWIEAGWLMVLIVTPLAFNVDSTRIFEPEKATLVRAAALVMTVAWILRWAGTGRAWRPLEGCDDRGRRLLHATLLAITFVLAVDLVATIFSVAPRVSWWGSHDRLQGMATTLAYVVIAALVVSTLRSAEQWRRLVDAVILTSIPVALYAVAQSLGHDPISWGGDFGQRVGSTLGNPVFLGGYLAPVVLLTAGELIARWQTLTRSTPADPGRRIASGPVFGLALALQLTALVLSQSRGPTAGLLAGVFTASLSGLLVARGSAPAGRAGAWRRHAWLLAIGGVLLTAAVFVAAGRSGSPLPWWRELPGIGRMLSSFDPEEPTTRFRALVWGGVDQLWRSARPIAGSADGEDLLAAFRPLIGYGPETLRVTLPSVSPPELAHLEHAHVVPDRAHNEVFDVLATTGLLGLGAFLALWGCVFANVASALGGCSAKGDEQDAPGRSPARLGWTLGGSTAAAVAAVVVAGKPMLLGLAVPAGCLIGFTGYAIAGTVRGRARPPRGRQPAETLRVMALAGALVAHFVEIQVGIAVTATRSYFWILMAVLTVVATAGLERRTAPPSSKTGDADRRHRWSHELLSEMLVTTTVLITLVFVFAAEATRAGDGLAMLTRDLADRPAVVVILAATWLFAWTASWARGRRPGAVLRGAVGSLLLTLAFSGLSSAVLAELARRQQTRPPGEAGSWIAAPYITWLATLLLLLVAISSALAGPSRRALAEPSTESRGREIRWRHFRAIGLGLAAAVVAAVLVERVSLRPIRADMVFKYGQTYFDQERFDPCLDLYRLALATDPTNDRLWLARGHLERIRATRASGESDRQRWLEQAASSIDRAVELHPLFIDHRVYRSQLHSLWSEMSPDPRAAHQHLEHALQDLQLAAARSPGSTGLRNQVAELHLRLGHRLQAEALLQRSLDLDPRTVETYLALIRLRLEDAASAESLSAAETLSAALELCDRALAVAPRASELHAGRGYVLTRLGRLEPAVAAYSRAVAIHPDDTASHLSLAILHHQLGRPRPALEHAHRAHASRDPIEKSRAAQLIRELRRQTET